MAQHTTGRFMSHKITNQPTAQIRGGGHTTCSDLTFNHAGLVHAHMVSSKARSACHQQKNVSSDVSNKCKCDSSWST